jgi:transcriptional regulator NrdR family protein
MNTVAVSGGEQPLKRGLECPTCGCRHLPVRYTRQGTKYVLRVRTCRHCGRRVTTRESVTG